MEEWRHGLRASDIILWFGQHKNLAYLKTAKRLNSRQARWALFLGRFQFTLTYRPGSKNTKADALLRQYAAEVATVPPQTILPSSCVVAALT